MPLLMCLNGTWTTFLNGGPVCCKVYRLFAALFLPVIPELEGDAEVVAAQHADDILQLVL